MSVHEPGPVPYFRPDIAILTGYPEFSGFPDYFFQFLRLCREGNLQRLSRRTNAEILDFHSRICQLFRKLNGDAGKIPDRSFCLIQRKTVPEKSILQRFRFFTVDLCFAVAVPDNQTEPGVECGIKTDGKIVSGNGGKIEFLNHVVAEKIEKRPRVPCFVPEQESVSSVFRFQVDFLRAPPWIHPSRRKWIKRLVEE